MKKSRLYKYLFYVVLLAFIALGIFNVLTINNPEKVLEETASLESIAVDEENPSDTSEDVIKNKDDVEQEQEIAVSVSFDEVIESCTDWNLGGLSYECITEKAIQEQNVNICQFILKPSAEPNYFEISFCIDEYRSHFLSQKLEIDLNEEVTDMEFEEVLLCLDYSINTEVERECITGLALHHNKKQICFEITDEFGDFDSDGTLKCVRSFE